MDVPIYVQTDTDRHNNTNARSRLFVCVYTCQPCCIRTVSMAYLRVHTHTTNPPYIHIHCGDKHAPPHIRHLHSRHLLLLLVPLPFFFLLKVDVTPWISPSDVFLFSFSFSLPPLLSEVDLRSLSPPPMSFPTPLLPSPVYIQSECSPLEIPSLFLLSPCQPPLIMSYHFFVQPFYPPQVVP